jgi:hypothetical protein
MRARIPVIAVATLAIAACAPVPKQSPPPPRAPAIETEALQVPTPASTDAAPAATPAPTEAAPAAAPAEAAPAPADQGEPETPPLAPVDLRVMKCSTLNSASDDDKAYAATFLLGYRSGLAHLHILDTKKIDAVETAAMADCAGKPDAIASKVFAEAQMKVEAGSNPPRPHRAYRKPAPMRYAPAQGTPAPETPPEPSPLSPAESPPAAPSPGEKSPL